jgi:hypothetical protein
MMVRNVSEESAAIIFSTQSKTSITLLIKLDFTPPYCVEKSYFILPPSISQNIF